MFSKDTHLYFYNWIHIAFHSQLKSFRCGLSRWSSYFSYFSSFSWNPLFFSASLYMGIDSLTLLCMRWGGGGGVNLPSSPCRIFFNNSFFTQAKSLKFSDLSFYPLETMWRNFNKKYWLVDKLWHFCHQWLEIFCEEKFFFLQTHVNVFY